MSKSISHQDTSQRLYELKPSREHKSLIRRQSQADLYGTYRLGNAARVLGGTTTLFGIAACGGQTSVSDNEQDSPAFDPSLIHQYVDLSRGVIQINADVRKRDISDYFQPAQMPNIVKYDPYDLEPEYLFLPVDWIGEHVVHHDPSANLGPLIGRGITIKDIGLSDNPGFILPEAPGYTDRVEPTLKEAFSKLIDDLHVLGVEYVHLPQWTWGSVTENNQFRESLNNAFGCAKMAA
jgi:hypothetical protein